VRRGVYATAAVLASATPLQRHDLECVALLLQLDRPTAVISHGSAARVWGLPMRRDSDPLLRLTDPREWRRGKDFVVAQAPLHEGDSVRRGPIRLTSATRTLVDCAREWDLESSVVALDAALLAQVTTPGALTGALDRCAYWPGAPRARRAVSLSDGRAESPLESRGRLRLLGAGLPPDELQVEIRVGSRLVAVVDAWFDRAAVAVEFDGAGHVHTTLARADSGPGGVGGEAAGRRAAITRHSRRAHSGRRPRPGLADGRAAIASARADPGSGTSSVSRRSADAGAAAFGLIEDRRPRRDAATPGVYRADRGAATRTTITGRRSRSYR
jgi:hypothetical protein